MCGRYYVDDETSREIEKIVKKLDQRLKIEHGQDIHPSESAVILTKECTMIIDDIKILLSALWAIK